MTQESDTLAASPAEHEPWDRRVPLQGSANFRDIGGYLTTDGSSVRRGVVFRSGSLDQLSEDFRLLHVTSARIDENCLAARD